MSQAALPQEVERQVSIGKALELRIGGANYRQIANLLKVSVGTAHAYVNEGLEQLRDANGEAFEQLRLIEVARLDSMLVSLWSKRGNPRVADTILRVSERRARLLGLDVRGLAEEPPPPPNSPTLPTTITITLITPDGAAREIPSTVESSHD
jgi:hypothetical protein